MKKHHPDFVSRTLETEKIYKKLFPSKKYNRAVIRNLISQMIFITEEYLAFANFRKDSLEYKKHLLDELKTRNVDRLFVKNLDEAFQILESSKIRDEHYYSNKYELQSIKRSFQELKLPVGKRLPVHEIIPNEMDNLTYAFFITLMKEYFSLYNVQMQLNFECRFRFFDEIMNHIEREKETYKQVPLIYILYLFLSLFIKGENEEMVPALKEMIDKNSDLMNKQDFDNFYIELYNYYKNRQFLGDKSYGKKSFELIKEMLEKDIFIREGNIMTAHSYSNIVHAAAREHELEWAEEFINKYKNKLPVTQRENAYLYNSAALNYMKGILSDTKESKKQFFDKSLDLLARVKSEDFYYMTRIKNSLIRIYFELNEFELAKFVVINYRQYLKGNNIIPKDLKERYNNFIDFSDKLIKWFNRPDEYTLIHLKNQISMSKNTEYKGWLLKKIEEFEALPKRTVKMKTGTKKRIPFKS